MIYYCSKTIIYIWLNNAENIIHREKEKQRERQGTRKREVSGRTHFWCPQHTGPSSATTHTRLQQLCLQQLTSTHSQHLHRFSHSNKQQNHKQDGIEFLYFNIYQHENKKGQIATEKVKEKGQTKETDREEIPKQEEILPTTKTLLPL